MWHDQRSLIFSLRWSPSLIAGQWIVCRQQPEWVGAPQKRFTRGLGLLLAIGMFFLMVVIRVIGPFNMLVCETCPRTAIQRAWVDSTRIPSAGSKVIPRWPLTLIWKFCVVSVAFMICRWNTFSILPPLAIWASEPRVADFVHDGVAHVSAGTAAYAFVLQAFEDVEAPGVQIQQHGLALAQRHLENSPETLRG